MDLCDNGQETETKSRRKSFNPLPEKGLPIPNRLAPHLLMALMLAASVWLWRFWANDEAARAWDHFDEYCEEVSQNITVRLNAHKMILQGGAGTFSASEEVTREGWRAYVEYHQVQRLYPGIQGLGFVKVIAPAELAQHVERVRAEGFPEYAVRPDGERAIYTSIVFLEPFDARNRRAFGYDMFSEPVRRAAMERARDTATPALSGRVHLVQETDVEVQAGFLLYVPVFARGMPQTGVEERRAALMGYVYAPFRVKDFMRSIFAERSQKVAFDLYDGATISPEALLFASREPAGGSGNGHRARFSSRTPLELYGHTWSLAFRSTPQFDSEKAPYLSWIVLAAGLALNILVFLLMRSQQRTAAKATMLAEVSADLRESEQRLIHLNTVSPAVVYTLAPADFSPTWVSPNVTALTGYAPDEALQLGWWAGHLHPEDRERALAGSSAVFDAGRTVHEYRFQRKDGEFVWILDELRLLRDDQGQPVEIVGSWRDITELKQAEESNTRLATAVEQAADVIFITDADARILYANPAFEKVTGYSRAEALGQNPRFLKSGKQDAAFYRRMWAVLAAGETWRGHFVNKRKNGTLYEEEAAISPVFDAAGKLINYVAGKHDVTREVQLEAQLRQAQRMEAVGCLAGGVAHDFNNLLMGIMGYAELCRDEIEPGHPIREYLDEITGDAQRSTEIIRQLLAFARKQTIAPRVLDLDVAVAGMLKLLRRLIGEDIKLTWRPGADVPSVRIDPSQVDQLLANLCVNARDAIAGVGEVVLETGHVVIDAEFCASHLEAIPGAYVFLAVSDDGGGMDQETLAQVFEPFFTTKGLGKGTGLGLATVYGIVKQNNGFIDATSEPGKGTTFRIYLPQVEAGAAKTPETPRAEIPRGCGETVLLVEDEKSLLFTCGRFLEDLGYKVLSAETPGEALAIAARHPGNLHVLLTDVVMPGMDGRQLSKRIRAVEPGVKVVFMSGYTADVIAQRGVQDDGVQFLSKPFTRDDLARKLRKALGISAT